MCFVCPESVELLCFILFYCAAVTLRHSSFPTTPVYACKLYTTHTAEGQKVAENKFGFRELQIVAAFEIVSGGWCRVLTFRAWVTWAPGLSCPLHTVDIRQSLSCLLKTLFLNWSNIYWLHDSRALIPLWVCDRPINFNQRLPLPFWQLTQATKLTPITSNFMAIKFSSILDKYKWTFVSRIVFQNIFHWVSVYIMEGRIHGQFVCF